MTRHVDGTRCECPLSSLHCKSQTRKRARWFHAVTECNADAITMILKADPVRVKDLLRVRDPETRTALHIIAGKGAEECFDVLMTHILQQPAPAKIVNLHELKEKTTSLMIASQAGHLRMISELVEAGAKTHHISAHNLTAKEYALRGGHAEIVEFFEGLIDEPESEGEGQGHAEKHKDGAGLPAEELGMRQSGAGSPLVNPNEQAVPTPPSVELEEQDLSTDQGDLFASMTGHRENHDDDNEKEMMKAIALEERVRLMSTVSFFPVFNVRELRELAAKCVTFVLQPQEQIVRKDTEAPSMFIIATGELQVMLQRTGNSRKVETVGLLLSEGETFGEALLLTGDPVSATFTARGSCTVVELSKTVFSDFLHNNLKFLANLSDFLASHLVTALFAMGMEVKDEQMISLEMQHRIMHFFGIQTGEDLQTRPAQHSMMHEHRGRDSKTRRIDEVPLATTKSKRDLNLMHALFFEEESVSRKKMFSDKGDQDSGSYYYVRSCCQLSVRPVTAFLLQLRSRHLILRDRHLTGMDGIPMGMAIMHNKYLTKINIAGNRLGELGFVGQRGKENGFLDGIHRNGQITDLTLECTGLTRGGGVRLGQMLTVNTSLTVLKLANNYIGDKGAAAIATGMHHCNVNSKCNITYLDVSNNRVGNGGATAFGKMLSVNDGLQDLNLGWNHILEKGAVSVLDALHANKTLHSLSIEWNMLGPKGGKALGMMLSVNQTLQRLDAKNCRMDESCCTELCSGIKENKTLKIIKVDWNPFGEGLPALLVALAFNAPTHSPHFSAENCQYDVLAYPQTHVVDENNPTGHYKFDLTNQHQRTVLKMLVELGMNNAGENWRNEKIDEKHFFFPRRGEWVVPDRGILELDFVHMVPVPETEESMASHDFRSLMKQLNRVMGSSGKVSMVKQVSSSFYFDAEQVIEILLALFREVERENALVHLFARLKDRKKAMPQILLRCFERDKVDALQQRLGPANVWDEFRPAGRYRLNMFKEKDRKLLGKIQCMIESGQCCGKDVDWSFAIARHYPVYGSHSFTEFDGSNLFDDGCTPQTGMLDIEIVAEAKTKEANIFLADGNLWKEVRQRENASTPTKLPKMKRSSSRRRCSISKEAGGMDSLPSIGANSSYDMKDDDYSVVGSELSASDSNAELAFGPALIPLPRRMEEVETLERELRIIQEILERRRRAASKGQEIIYEASLHQPEVFSSKQSPISVTTVTPSHRPPPLVDDTKRKWKPWADFRRSRKVDFEVQRINIKTRRSGSGGIQQEVQGSLGVCSCGNYEVDLSIPVKVHTIPRHIYFTVTPGADLELYADTKGLPWLDSFIWEGKMQGASRVILINPTDPRHIAGTYYITVVAKARGSEYTLAIGVNPDTSVLMDVPQQPGTEENLSPTQSSEPEHKPGTSRRPKIRSDIKISSSKTLNQIMAFSAERVRKSAMGARVPQKEQLAEVFRRPVIVASEQRPDDGRDIAARPSSMPSILNIGVSGSFDSLASQ